MKRCEKVSRTERDKEMHNMEKMIARVFPRKTSASPTDELAFFAEPTIEAIATCIRRKEWRRFQREWCRPMIVGNKFREFCEKEEANR